MKSLFSLACYLVLALQALSLPTHAEEKAVASESKSQAVNVLVLSAWRLEIDPEVAKQFGAQDIHFVVRKISDPLSAEMLRQFNVVLIADWEGPRTSHFFPRNGPQNYLTMLRNLELIDQFVKAGGGFFFTPSNGSEMAAHALTQFLAPYGAAVQSAQVRDDKHAYSNLKPEDRSEFFDYSWTTNVADHPATQGVKTVFYPTPQLRWDDMYSTPVMKLEDKAWKTLVRAMPSSVAAKAVDYYNWLPQGGTKPPLVAVRDVGKGRMALFAVNPFYTLWKPYDRPKDGWIWESHTGKIDGVVLEKGDGEKKSDVKPLLIGLLRWLADTGRDKGMGGYTAETFAALPVPDPVPPPDWLYTWKPDDGNQWFKVMVGARSDFSDGKGTVAEYAEAAKKAGVSVLYMTETFEKFDSARWEEFREACRKASDDKIKVVAGLDLPDLSGNRYLLLGSPVFPAANLLSEDGKAIAKPQYLCLCFPMGITVQHRPGSSTVPHELHKHFQGVGVYTYKDGELIDNGFPAYEWQTFRFSNPLPFVVHEMYSPEALDKEASTGHQMLVSADKLDSLMWYLGEHGISHFWESPVRIQITAGPRITALGGARTSQPGEESVKDALSFKIESDEPIKEVRLMENFGVYRRWTPNEKTFEVTNVKLPEEHVNWIQIVATDAKGNTVVSPGVLFGRQIAHTWRCADRQNWWNFPNIYTGTDLSQLNIEIPTFGTQEGFGLFPNRKGPLRGENTAALLDFSYASPAVYIQDVALGNRYPMATFDDAAFDAKPANQTAPGRIYDGRIRYHQYFLSDSKTEGKNDYLPHMLETELSLKRPLDVTGEIFPILTNLDLKHIQVRGDMSYAYVDPATGQEVTGKLENGYLDLPKGGRVGGFIALSDGLRVGANGRVGFTPPMDVAGPLPRGTTWKAKFVAVDPEKADVWRRLMGVKGELPYTLSLKQGKLESLNYVAEYKAENRGIRGSVDKVLDPALLKGLYGGKVNKDGEAKGAEVTEYGLPVYVEGVNYNWPAALIREGEMKQVDVFEGKARARLDVTKTGDFYIGNTIVAGDPALKIGLLRWKADGITLEVNNPTNKPIKTRVETLPVNGLLQHAWEVTIPAGSSQILKAPDAAAAKAELKDKDPA